MFIKDNKGLIGAEMYNFLTMNMTRLTPKIKSTGGGSSLYWYEFFIRMDPCGFMKDFGLSSL